MSTCFYMVLLLVASLMVMILVLSMSIYSARNFRRAIVMPNLRPPITTTAAAVEYHESILKVLPNGSDFMPLMTLYLTDSTSPREIKLASESLLILII